MLKFFTLLILSFASFGESAVTTRDDPKPQYPICNLSGRWKNQLGSEVSLLESNYRIPGIFYGPYYTAVESSNGAAGNNTTGQAMVALHPKNRHSFVMSVLWAGGSLTSWVGQCFFDNKGIEVLETTWLLLSPQAKQQDAWLSVRIGKDFFHRIAV